MFGVVQNGLPRRVKLGLFAKPAPGVRVAVEAREVAARDLDADAVAWKKDVARGADVDSELSGLIGREEDRCRSAVSVARPDDAVGQGAGGAVGEDVNELRGEICIRLRARRPEGDADRPGRLERGFDRRRRVDENVAA